MVRTVGSLFSGIGGLDLGLERAGWEVRWQSEIDPYCCQVLARHWPHVPDLGDVRTIDWSTVERVDLVAGGFPCQPVAQNGHRRGTKDDRWLWPEFARALRHLRPRLALVENVDDLPVRGLGVVLGDLAALGFDAEWCQLPAAAIGAPHRRIRTFIVAHAYGLGCEADGVLTGDLAADLGEANAWRSVPRRNPDGRVRRWPDPDVLGVADGVPRELDRPRLRALGNAVVPQVAEWIGRRIMAVPEW